MLSDKEQKKQFKKTASENPDKYYATSVLKEKGFMRKKCPSCGLNFWTVNEDQETCGDNACSGGFRFFEDNPSKVQLSYVESWQKFSEMFKGFGYEPISRYPVVARWNPTMEYVNASIADFQPYVISGEVKPPAEKLVVPQFCLRFGDIDNVGVTGSHLTGFVMIGQHMFVPPEKWSQEEVFRHILTWLTDGLGLPLSELTFHEDAWAGGGNFGPCMEYFCRGVELGNQVYMMYEQTPDGPEELKLKVLDMGMGQERIAWFTQGTNTIYEATFPGVINKLIERTGVLYDHETMKRFVPHAGKLNIDEVDDINKAWEEVAGLVGMPKEELRDKIEPLTGIFSIAEHARSLLFALSDGALPSNVGGGYNLRVLVRRALSFIDKFGWDIRLADVCKWHAEELRPIFPELSENLYEVEQILNVEREKFEQTKEKTHAIVSKIVNEDITEEKMIELYDSYGIPPQLVKSEAEMNGVKVDIPEDFFGKVSERHGSQEQVHATEKPIKIDLSDVPDTKALYFDDYKLVEFKGKVLKIIDNYVILDQTAFYPTSGGQMHDVGELNGQKVVDVFKQGAIIVHEIESKPSFGEGEVVEGRIDYDNRLQLTQHHTVTHLVNVAARKILGRHVNQAGAKKTLEKAHLDITHFKNVSDEEIKQIEDETNKIIEKTLPVNKFFMSRDEAEQAYGMGIYQGGAVPGKKLRLVEIPDLDVEACGGTHLDNTGEAGKVKILRSVKIQDGVVRLEYVVGKALEEISSSEQEILDNVARLLGVEIAQIPGRVEELFNKWKKAKKAVKKGKELPNFEFESTETFDGDVLTETARVLKTQPQHVLKTVKRFKKELEEIQSPK